MRPSHLEECDREITEDRSLFSKAVCVHACVQPAMYVCECFIVHVCSGGAVKIICVIKLILLSQGSKSSAHHSCQIIVQTADFTHSSSFFQGSYHIFY